MCKLLFWKRNEHFAWRLWKLWWCDGACHSVHIQFLFSNWNIVLVFTRHWLAQDNKFESYAGYLGHKEPLFSYFNSLLSTKFNLRFNKVFWFIWFFEDWWRRISHRPMCGGLCICNHLSLSALSVNLPHTLVNVAIIWRKLYQLSCFDYVMLPKASNIKSLIAGGNLVLAFLFGNTRWLCTLES